MLQEDLRAHNMAFVDTRTQQYPKSHLRCLNIRKKQCEAFLVVPKACGSFSRTARTAVLSPFLEASNKTSSAESCLLFGGFSSCVLSACRFDIVCLCIVAVSFVLVLSIAKRSTQQHQPVARTAPEHTTRVVIIGVRMV